MSTDLDTARVVRSWLRTDEHESADRILATVLVAVDTIPQRRRMPSARRIADMNTYAKFAVAAVAVLALAVVGFNLLPGGGGSPAVGGPPASPPASRSAPPSPSESPESRVWPPATLTAQRYQVNVAGSPISFAIPSNRWRPWGSEAIETGSKPGGKAGDDYAWMFLPGVENTNPLYIATDPCAGEARPVDVSSLDNHAAAFTTVAGTTAEEPVDVTLGGYPAKLVEFTIDPDPPCDMESFWLYGDTSLHPNKDTSIIRTWITDVDGQRWVILTDQAAPDQEIEEEIQQIVDSIQFE